MKKLIYVFVLVLAACGGGAKKELPNNLNSLKTALVEKEKSLAMLKQEITDLKDKIAKLDTSVSFKKILVTTQVAAAEKFVHTIDVQGHVTGDQILNVSPQIPAVYSRILVVKGSNVAKGQILATLDDNVVRQGVEELKSGIEFAKTVYEKQKALWDQKIGSEIQYLTAKNNLESLNKKLVTMNQQLAMYKLKSPINGVIDDVMAKEGEMGSPGMPSIKVVNLNTLKIEANLAEANVDKVKIGNKAEVSFPDLGKTIQSTVKNVGKVINSLNRTFTADIALPATSDYRPNMLCIVKITDYANQSAITVPINVVGKVDDEFFVYVAEEKEGLIKASKRKVTLGLNNSDRVEIKSGLKSGDKIITVGYQDVNEGDVVDVSK
jgi:RND family efflux transporter MFP subunit